MNKKEIAEIKKLFTPSPLCDHANLRMLCGCGKEY